MEYITQISRLNNCGVFRSFKWPSDLLIFGRYNLIYGWNGTGKTTLGNLLRSLELREQPKLGEVTLRIGDNDVRGDSFPRLNFPIRVFNRDFIEENVFPPNGEMRPILVLGKESVEKQKRVERLKKENTETLSILESYKKEEERSVRIFEKFCSANAKHIKETLQSSDHTYYNNYKRDRFKNDAEDISKRKNSSTYCVDDETQLRLQIKAQPMPSVKTLSYAMPNFISISNRLQGLLKTTITSQVIRSLKDDPDLSTWVRRGLILHRERGENQCQFCKQSLSAQRTAEIESHFNRDYESFIGSLDEEIHVLEKLLGQLMVLESTLPDGTALYIDFRSEFLDARANLADTIKELREFFNTAVTALEHKKQSVFKATGVETKIPSINAAVVDDVNAMIQKHNHKTKNFKTQLVSVRERLAGVLIAKRLEDFHQLTRNVDKLKRKVASVEADVLRKKEEIARLENEITEHRRPAEELNRDLRKYLRHDELRVEVKDTGYAISRKEMPTKSLSEGETTAIALLYFLRSLRDKTFSLEDGVVVLDDPVSSLDDNALFLAFGFIREHTKKAGQLFVMTHNFSLFRQIRNWYRHMTNQNKKESKRPARFYMLEPSMEEESRNSVIRRLDPLLEEYDSVYHYLFARVCKASTDLGFRNLERNYVLPNIARRMLETFLAFRHPDVPNNLRKQLERVRFDETKKHRIIQFLHTHSHNAAVGEPEHDLTALGEGPAVLKDLLEMINSVDHEHYSAMMRLLDSNEK